MLPKLTPKKNFHPLDSFLLPQCMVRPQMNQTPEKNKSGWVHRFVRKEARVLCHLSCHWYQRNVNFFSDLSLTEKGFGVRVLCSSLGTTGMYDPPWWDLAQRVKPLEEERGSHFGKPAMFRGYLQIRSHCCSSLNFRYTLLAAQSSSDLTASFHRFLRKFSSDNYNAVLLDFGGVLTTSPIPGIRKVGPA